MSFPFAPARPASAPAGWTEAVPPEARTPYAGPAVRKLARELGIDLRHVDAHGAHGRILREDVMAHVRRAALGRTGAQPAPLLPPVAATGEPASAMDFPIPLAKWPEPDHASYGPVEEAAMTRIQRFSAANLARNWVMVPHVTNFASADITETEAFRVALNAKPTDDVKITLLAFLIKAAVSALKAFPRFNVSFVQGKLIQKRYFHIGFAADTPHGLVVAVVRDCDQKGLLQIAREVRALSEKARKGALTPAEMSGGCFTVSSLGGVEGTGFTPIINAPEVAILGAARAQMQPVWSNGTFVPRLMLPLCLSWDHRAVDGAMAARFLAHLSAGMSDARNLSL